MYIARLFKYLHNMEGEKCGSMGPDVLEVGVILIVIAVICIFWLKHSDRV
jgi:hypothetical protein